MVLPGDERVILQRARDFARRFRANAQGVTAIEFGFVALPFMLFVFGIMAAGLQFFTVNALDNAVETAARKISHGRGAAGRLDHAEFQGARL